MAGLTGPPARRESHVRQDGGPGRLRSSILIGGIFSAPIFCVLIFSCFPASASAQTQTSSPQYVRLCIPRNLVESENWEHPYPCSRIQQLTGQIKNYLLEH